MTQQQLDAHNPNLPRRKPSIPPLLLRIKLRLQFTGWLQYLITATAAAVFLLAAALGWLIGVWPWVLFWPPLAIGLSLLTTAAFDVITVKWGVRPPEPLPHRNDDVDVFDLIRNRRSCRSFQSRDLTADDRGELLGAVAEYTHPDQVIGANPIRLEYVAAPLTVWPVAGAHEFLVAIAPRNYDRQAIIDVGRSLQKVVLHATRVGLATCWIGPGADQSSAIKHLGGRFDPDNDHVVCVCAVGYKSRFLPLSIRLMTQIGRRRLPLTSLFFTDPELQMPLDVNAAPFSAYGRSFEACQWSPSSFNAQPTRCAAVTQQGGAGRTVVRFDFYATNKSRFYTPVALGIWAANWEAGCTSLGIPGYFAMARNQGGEINDVGLLPHRDLSWIPD